MQNGLHPTKHDASQAFTLVEMMIVMAILGLIVSIAIPNFLKSRNHARKQVCIENLSQIETAKQLWGLERGKREGEVPTEADLIGPTLYIKRMPECPGAGTYNFQPLGTAATCDQSGHTL